MQIISDLAKADLKRDSSLAVGVFDGVHQGHQHLLRQVLGSAREKGWLAGAVTFQPDPREVLTPHEPPRYLTSVGDRIDLLGNLGLDFVALLPFTPQLAQIPSEQFVLSLVKYLRLKELWVGPGFALGRGREGDVDRLKYLGRRLGFHVRQVKPLRVRGVVASSTRIRDLIVRGRVSEAADLLGRPPTLQGIVVKGAVRGKALGYPTANLALERGSIIPADGVYAARVYRGGENHPAVVNVGRRPTFGGGERMVEAHLLDFHDNLYGERLKVELVKRLRGERRFASSSALIAQMGRDVEEARAIL